MSSDRKAVRDAASVVLVRRGSRGPETFWVRRGDQLNFAGGFYAFPGGRVDKADAELPLRHAEGLGALERALLGAAARELFEETGVLAVRGSSHVARAERDRVRARLVERPGDARRKGLPGMEPATTEAPRDEAGEAAGFGAFLARHDLAIDARDFLPAGRSTSRARTRSRSARGTPPAPCAASTPVSSNSSRAVAPTSPRSTAESPSALRSGSSASALSTRPPAKA